MGNMTKRPEGAPVLYTSAEAGAILRVSRTTLWRLTQSGELYAVRVGKRVLYPREAIDARLRGERFDPTGGAAETHADVSTWPPTPSLLSSDTPR